MYVEIDGFISILDKELSPNDRFLKMNMSIYFQS